MALRGFSVENAPGGSKRRWKKRSLMGPLFPSPYFQDNKFGVNYRQIGCVSLSVETPLIAIEPR